MAKRRDQPTSTAETAPSQDQAEYTVVARRYRPQQLSELIGQEHVAQALTNAIQSGRIAHAYLFTGARGVGKTSAARILAKALNCERGPTPQPCDQCEICQGIMAGDDVDVLEIDGASNNKVEEVRELRSNVGFLPTRARYKIYIIDEVHMLSTGAFNALLKTLEEPPPHVKFIFATTEVQKIPITILSRCQRFDFAHVKSQQIYDQLAKIVQREGLKADEESLQIIARRAAGSMRDSQSLLDQLLAFSEGDLTADKVHSLLGTPGETRVQQLADAILNHDTAQALSIVAECARQGLQLGELLDQLIDFWRGMMLIHVVGKTAPDLSGTTTHREKMAELAERVNLDTVLAGIDLLAAAKGKLRGSTHGQILIEVAIVRLSRLDELLAVHQIAEWLSSPREGGTPAPAGAARAHAPAPDGAKKKTTGGNAPR